MVVALIHLTLQTTGFNAVDFTFDHDVTLAAQFLEFGSVQNRYVPAFIFDRSELLQLAGGLGDAFTTHAQHVGDQFMGNVQAVAR